MFFSPHVPAFSHSHELELLQMTEQLDVIPDLPQFLIPFINKVVGTVIFSCYSRTITHRAEWSYAPLPTQEFSWNNQQQSGVSKHSPIIQAHLSRPWSFTNR